MLEEIETKLGDVVFKTLVDGFRANTELTRKQMSRQSFVAVMRPCGLTPRQAIVFYEHIWPWDRDYTREGIFQTHRCAYCDSGMHPCVELRPDGVGCSKLHARND